MLCDEDIDDFQIFFQHFLVPYLFFLQIIVNWMTFLEKKNVYRFSL